MPHNGLYYRGISSGFQVLFTKSFKRRLSFCLPETMEVAVLVSGNSLISFSQCERCLGSFARGKRLSLHALFGLEGDPLDGVSLQHRMLNLADCDSDFGAVDIDATSPTVTVTLEPSISMTGTCFSPAASVVLGMSSSRSPPQNGTPSVGSWITPTMTPHVLHFKNFMSDPPCIFESSCRIPCVFLCKYHTKFAVKVQVKCGLNSLFCGIL